MMIVVAAAIADQAGQFLLQQRPAHKAHGGLWEFPGGKVENGENPRFALRREIEEELGLVLDTGAMEPAGFAEQAADEGHHAIVLLLYRCPVWRGEPEAREGQRFGGFPAEQARALDMPPMDRALLRTIAR